ncbi:MAG: hypothetical protein KC483_03640 [Nitrosarchaeum sp.]|nr:hypothetical protein [Nitrosarchaeum sp.]
MILDKAFLASEAFEFSSLVELSVGIFSIVLFALAITAYKKTGSTRIIFAATAFVLFAIQLFVEYLDDALELLEEDAVDLVLSGITLSILLLFFFAIVKRK